MKRRTERNVVTATNSPAGPLEARSENLLYAVRVAIFYRFKVFYTFIFRVYSFTRL